MNIITYNLVKYQSDNKLNNKILAERLNCSKKEIREMKKESYCYTQEQINQIAKMMFITEEELQNEMNERINIQERKIYGTDYLFLNYKVLNYKTQNINLISCMFDILYFITFVIFIITNVISLNNPYQDGILNVLKIILMVEILVFPFMFIVLPVLKIYFNRTYEAKLTTSVKQYYQEEACGIVFSCLRRNINKSIIPYVFTIFSEAVIALYSIIYIKNSGSIFSINNIGYIIMIILFIVSLSISIYSFRYHSSKYGSNVRKEE